MNTVPARGAPPERVEPADLRPVGRVAEASLAALRKLVRLVLRLAFRLRIENPPRLEGGCVVVANHASFLDPMVLGSAMPRRVVFLMTVLHFRSPWLGWFYRWNRAIPLAMRTPNREPMRAARALLARGGVLGVFPEGGVSRDGRLVLGSPGAVALVLAEDVPVIPAHIEGAETALPLGGGWPRRRQIVVRFGEPISHAELLSGAAVGDRRSRLQVATQVIMDRIAALGGVESREAALQRIVRSRASSGPNVSPR